MMQEKLFGLGKDQPGLFAFPKSHNTTPQGHQPLTDTEVSKPFSSNYCFQQRVLATLMIILQRQSSVPLISPTHKRRCLEMGIDLDLTNISQVEIMIRAAVMFATEGNWTKAAQITSMAAPYVLPRLSAVDLNTKMKHYQTEAMMLADLEAGIEN